MNYNSNYSKFLIPIVLSILLFGCSQVKSSDYISRAIYNNLTYSLGDLSNYELAGSVKRITYKYTDPHFGLNCVEFNKEGRAVAVSYWDDGYLEKSSSFLNEDTGYYLKYKSIEINRHGEILQYSFDDNGSKETVTILKDKVGIIVDWNSQRKVIRPINSKDFIVEDYDIEAPFGKYKLTHVCVYSYGNSSLDQSIIKKYRDLEVLIHKNNYGKEKLKDLIYHNGIKDMYEVNYEYEYDNMNNWVVKKQTTIDSTGNIVIEETIREIEYF